MLNPRRLRWSAPLDPEESATSPAANDLIIKFVDDVAGMSSLDVLFIVIVADSRFRASTGSSVSSSGRVPSGAVKIVVAIDALARLLGPSGLRASKLSGPAPEIMPYCLL